MQIEFVIDMRRRVQFILYTQLFQADRIHLKSHLNGITTALTRKSHSTLKKTLLKEWTVGGSDEYGPDDDHEGQEKKTGGLGHQDGKYDMDDAAHLLVRGIMYHEGLFIHWLSRTESYERTLFEQG